MRFDVSFLVVLVYVDDILIGYKSLVVLDKFKTYLIDVFKLKGLGFPSIFWVWN